ncbi:MAG: hypothetical protein IJR89_06530 [Clostridia bacterium]|nr:hypothetical protein [Clostridia bacterium]
MNYEPFYERCRSLPETERKWAEAFCSTLDGVFDDEAFQSKQRACSLFYGKGTGLSKAQFYRKKKYIVELYQWLQEQGKVTQQFVNYVSGLKLEDVVSGTELDFYYFKDLDAVLGFVKEVGRKFDLYQDDDLLVIKSIVVLSWHSVDIKEMIGIKKSELDTANKTVHISGANERTIQLTEKEFSILKMFADKDIHKGFPMSKIQMYLSSRFLFRSTRQTQMSENNINCYLKRFNEEARQFGHALSLTALKKNGLFCEVLEKDNGEQSVNSILTPKCADRAMAFGYARFYQAWKERYHK